MRLHKYDVRGVGQFPLDMLRYDAAWPAESEDVVTITRSFIRDDRAVYTVSLRSNFSPAVTRWESFGWVVVSKGATK